MFGLHGGWCVNSCQLSTQQAASTNLATTSTPAPPAPHPPLLDWTKTAIRLSPSTPPHCVCLFLYICTCRCCCLFYKAAKDIQQPEIQQLAWEQLSSNLHSLVQQHDVFVQLELEDVLRLFRGPEDTSTAAAAGAEGDAAAGGGGGGVITGPHGLSAGGGAGAAGSSSSPGGGVAAGAGAAGSSSGVTAVSGSLRWWGSNPSTSRSTGSVANRLAAAGGTGAEPLGIYLLG